MTGKKKEETFVENTVMEAVSPAEAPAKKTLKAS